MSTLAHRIYLGSMVVLVVLTIVFLCIKGIPYYETSLEERFYHPEHHLFKPSGVLGHGLGIIGTLLILIGVFSYIARKRYRFLSKLGRLKYWLEFHIFLCVLGPIMILFHTAFKFGGIVSISFWSMVAVVVSGVIGRFIYIQIPRTISGREMSLNEVREMQNNVSNLIRNSYDLDAASYHDIVDLARVENETEGKNKLVRMVAKYFVDRKRIKKVKHTLRKNKIPQARVRAVTNLIRNEISLDNKIDRLQTMQQLFRYWHVAHLPFAVIMLLIMFVHVAITVAFGARWIF